MGNRIELGLRGDLFVMQFIRKRRSSSPMF